MILTTKLHVPPQTADLVHRPHLYARLDTSPNYPLTVLSAPAGFGKSTLLGAWLAQSDFRSTWLSLDERDDEATVFLSYFIAAVRKLHADACPETEAMIRLASPPDIDVLANQLVNELDVLPGTFALVLDDFHTIRDPAIHQLVASIVRRPPRPLHLIVAGRVDPPLPMPVLRAKGQMLELRSADLRFRRDETVAFLHQIPDLTIDETGVAILDEVIEGWPAGLRLATLSLRLSDDPARTLVTLAGERNYAADYLFQEILSHLPTETQTWLLRLSTADSFCADLCDELCPAPEDARTWPGGQAFIQWLHATNLFLTPQDDIEEWFRFHHLFLQLLRDRLYVQSDEAAVMQLQRKAGAWFAGKGMIEDSVYYYLATGDLDEVATLMVRARRHVINQEDWPRLTRWLGLLPAYYVEATPELWIIKAWSLQSRFRLNEVDLVLDQIEAHWDQLCAGQSAADAEILSAEIATHRSQNRFWAGDGARSLEMARYAVAHTPTDYTGVYGNALLYLGIAMQVAGQQEGGLARLTQALFSDKARQNPAFAARMLVALTLIHWVVADLTTAKRYASRLLDIANQRHLLASRGWAHLYLGSVHYWRDELQAAADHFGALVESPYGANSLAIIHGHCGLVVTYLRQARDADATEVLEAAFTFADQTGSLVHLQHVQALEAYVSLVRGRKAAAAAWADQNAGTHPLLPMYFMEIPALTWVRIRIAEGTQASMNQAAAALADLHRYVAETHNTIRLIDVLALDSILHSAQCDRPAALALLKQAVALAEPAGIVRPFVDLGPDMAALLHEVAKGANGSDYARRLLAAFPNRSIQGKTRAFAPQGQPDSTIEPLTDREIDVLKLLSQRLSDKEIAQILVISPVTVKTHLRNLFAKLQVHTRREAIARARSLGLLPTS